MRFEVHIHCHLCLSRFLSRLLVTVAGKGFSEGGFLCTSIHVTLGPSIHVRLNSSTASTYKSITSSKDVGKKRLFSPIYVPYGRLLMPPLSVKQVLSSGL